MVARAFPIDCGESGATLQGAFRVLDRILFSGQSPNQDAKAEALRNRDTSVPISDRMVWAVIALMPGTLVRSTPKIRYSSWRRSNAFGSYRPRLYGEALVRLGTAGSAVIAVSRLPS